MPRKTVKVKRPKAKVTALRAKRPSVTTTASLKGGGALPAEKQRKIATSM